MTITIIVNARERKKEREQYEQHVRRVTNHTNHMGKIPMMIKIDEQLFLETTKEKKEAQQQ